MYKKSILFCAALCVFIASSSWAGILPYNERLCRGEVNVPCIVVQKGDTWASIWPDAQKRDEAMRINRLNIRLRTGMLLADPDEMSDAQIAAFSPFPQAMLTEGEKVIIVSSKDLAWGAYDESGILVKWGPASTARGFCPDINEKCDTPSGIFTVYRKSGDWCESSKYPIPTGGAPMPYCMFFNGGVALHGSDQLPGFNASHGCVRLRLADAQWLNNEFVQVGTTKVIVTR